MTLPIIRSTDLTQGHCWAPTLPDPQTCSQTVFINGLPVVVVGSSYLPHTPGCTAPPTTHPVNTVRGSNTIYIEGRLVTRQGDPLSCGDISGGTMTPPPTVFGN